MTRNDDWDDVTKKSFSLEKHFLSGFHWKLMHPLSRNFFLCRHHHIVLLSMPFLGLCPVNHNWFEKISFQNRIRIPLEWLSKPSWVTTIRDKDKIIILLNREDPWMIPREVEKHFDSTWTSCVFKTKSRDQVSREKIHSTASVVNSFFVWNLLSFSSAFFSHETSDTQNASQTLFSCLHRVPLAFHHPLHQILGHNKRRKKFIFRVQGCLIIISLISRYTNTWILFPLNFTPLVYLFNCTWEEAVTCCISQTTREQIQSKAPNKRQENNFYSASSIKCCHRSEKRFTQRVFSCSRKHLHSFKINKLRNKWWKEDIKRNQVH